MSISSEVKLTGREAALLVGSVFALGEWDFEQAAAAALVTEDIQHRASEMGVVISERWRTSLREAGLWDDPSGYWTHELIERRSALVDALALDESEMKLAVEALTLVEVEFARDWDEFCIVVPGSLDWYGLEMKDVISLREKLVAALKMSHDPTE